MAIVANQRVLTLDLWKLASEIKEGDWVFNSDGKLVQVKLVQHYVSDECYEITFDDHLTIQGDVHLAMLLENKKYRLRVSTYKGVNKFRRPLRRYTVTDMLESDQRLSLPTTKPLNFPNQPLAIPPFLFGFWFFNRRYNKTLIPPAGMSEFVHNQFIDNGYKVTTHRLMKTGEREFRVQPAIESQFLGFLPKQIPNNYLYADAEQRLQLLSGIMYAKTRQYNEKTNWFVFTTKDHTISGQVRFLVESLGCKTQPILYSRDNRIQMKFKCLYPLIQNQQEKQVKVHHARRYINKIKKIARQSCVHIETNDKNGTFLVGEGFISAC